MTVIPAVPTAPVAAAPGQLVKIGTVAAANIAKALKLPEEAVQVVERAISDEINAMSSHFTLAVADVQTQYEAEVLRVKSAFTYVAANKWRVVAALAGVFAAGVVVGLVL